MKKCSKCGVEKDDSCFHVDNRIKGPNKIRAICKACYSERKKGYYVGIKREYYLAQSKARSKTESAIASRLVRTYGVDLAWFCQQYAKQRGMCKICGATIEARPSRNTHVDHDHSTGVVRGILCHKCNRGLGMFNDSVDLFIKAAEYIKASRG